MTLGGWITMGAVVFGVGLAFKALMAPSSATRRHGDTGGGDVGTGSGHSGSDHIGGGGDGGGGDGGGGDGGH